MLGIETEPHEPDGLGAVFDLADKLGAWAVGRPAMRVDQGVETGRKPSFVFGEINPGME